MKAEQGKRGISTSRRISQNFFIQKLIDIELKWEEELPLELNEDYSEP